MLGQPVSIVPVARLAACPACDAVDAMTSFVSDAYPLQRCSDCGLLFLNPQPVDEVLSRSQAARARFDGRALLDHIVDAGGPRSGRLLNVGSRVALTREATERGYNVRNVDATMGNGLEGGGLPSTGFDVCLCVDAIEYIRDPIDCLTRLHRALKPGGILLLVTSTADRRPDWFRRHLPTAELGPLHYFSRSTILNVLAKTGFRRVETSGDDSAVTIVCRAEPIGARPLVSIIVPAYNEGPTIRGTLDRLIAKEVRDIDKEVIIVESNSTDGTREAVLEYSGRPGIHVVLTDRPRGKGHAVRQGLQRAAGDFVLIQDADDEYDIDDYDALLEPLRLYQHAFVLGSRHKGHWRMRNFGGQASLTAFMNVGHILLTEFFNALYGQRLSDPWTMYKVFRRDCLYRMHLECNRFDFDVELVAKLVRRGFTPFEIPVSYRSRSFAEGKKIRVLRDPWSWFWACVKFRVTALDEPKVTR